MYGAVKNGIADSAPKGNKFYLSSGQGVNIPERRPPATVAQGFIVIIINTFRPLSSFSRYMHNIYIYIFNTICEYRIEYIEL